MGDKIHLIVVTPYKNFFEEQVSSVTIPALDGDLGVMAGHSPLVAALKPGICTVRIDSEVRHFSVSEGYCEIGQSIILVVCNSAEWPEDINVKQIFDSYNEAVEAIKNEKNTDLIHPEDSKHRKARALARMHLIELYGTDHQKARLETLKANNGLS